VKSLLLLLTALAITLVAGCVGQVATYDDPGQAIDTEVNQQFVIALGSNPTTGYSWQASYDETMLELVGGKSKYKPGEEAKGGLVGAGGVEYFRFKALKTGTTEITLVYKRPWEEPTPQDLTKVFTVHVQ
jgi:inhibitor of cysteine peptidase